MLALSLERLEYLIAKAKEFDVEVPIEPDAVSGQNASDDDEREAMLETPDNPAEQELRDAIAGLGTAERHELLALMWVGRGEYAVDEWPEALRQASRTADTKLTDYLVGTPLLGDYLGEGASILGLSVGISNRA